MLQETKCQLEEYPSSLYNFWSHIKWSSPNVLLSVESEVVKQPKITYFHYDFASLSRRKLANLRSRCIILFNVKIDPF